MMVYGIKNCSTVKKALTWFDSHQISYDFYDLKKDVLNVATLTAWFKKLPDHLTWDMLINKSGMTWRNLTDCLLYTSPSPRDRQKSRMPSSA